MHLEIDCLLMLTLHSLNAQMTSNDIKLLGKNYKGKRYKYNGSRYLQSLTPPMQVAPLDAP